MLPGDQCSGVSELAEGYTYMRGRCKQLGGLQIGDRDELECFTASEYDTLILKDNLHVHRSESFDQRSEDICRRISISAGDARRSGCSNASPTTLSATTSTNDECLSPTEVSKERRPSRDIGTQAYSIEFQNERSPSRRSTGQRASVSTGTDTRDRDTDENHYQRRNTTVEIGTGTMPQPQLQSQPPPFATATYYNYPLAYSGVADGEHSVILRRDSCHYHQPYCPSELFIAHCSYPSHLQTEYRTNDDTPLNAITNEGGAGHCQGNYLEMPHDGLHRKLSYQEHRNSIILHDDQNLEQGYSTCSSESSTLAKSIVDSSGSETIRKSKSGHVFLMDPCIEDSTEYAENDTDDETELNKPLIDRNRCVDKRLSISRKNSTAAERRQSFVNSKSLHDQKQRSSDHFSNANDIDLANNQEVCPFGLAKNLEKQICVVPNRKKSSGRISFLKLITFVLIGSAILITSAAIKEALSRRK